LPSGRDSAIELLSVVLRRFRDSDAGERVEKRAAQVAGVLLILLAIHVAAISSAALLGYAKAAASYPGVAVLVAATLVTAWFSWQEHPLFAIAGSAALRADAAESMQCAYLSLIALLGLLARSFLQVSWADPAAAVAATPLIIREGRRAFRGEACGCVVLEKM
jgi:divalent metal cation (Fe/Co/Zn/Cd) transporter